jgi:hypothetical protein
MLKAYLDGFGEVLLVGHGGFVRLGLILADGHAPGRRSK